MSVILKQGEAKNIMFTVTNSTGGAVDLSTALLQYYVEAKKPGIYIISKSDTMFNKTLSTAGIVSVNITSTETDISPGSYNSELEMIFIANTNVDKTSNIEFIIERAII